MPLSKSDAPANKAGASPEDSAPAEAIKQLAEKLPEKDEVQKAVKAGMLADDPKKEVAEKVKVVKASPDAEETPSGHALIKVAGISDDQKRGEEYTKHKTAKRWGYVPAEE
jgi:hypothetical protein